VTPAAKTLIVALAGEEYEVGARRRDHDGHWTICVWIGPLDVGGPGAPNLFLSPHYYSTEAQAWAMLQTDLMVVAVCAAGRLGKKASEQQNDADSCRARAAAELRRAAELDERAKVDSSAAEVLRSALGRCMALR